MSTNIASMCLFRAVTLSMFSVVQLSGFVLSLLLIFEKFPSHLHRSHRHVFFIFHTVSQNFEKLCLSFLYQRSFLSLAADWILCSLRLSTKNSSEKLMFVYIRCYIFNCVSRLFNFICLYAFSTERCASFLFTVVQTCTSRLLWSSCHRHVLEFHSYFRSFCVVNGLIYYL